MCPLPIASGMACCDVRCRAAAPAILKARGERIMFEIVCVPDMFEKGADQVYVIISQIRDFLRP